MMVNECWCDCDVCAVSVMMEGECAGCNCASGHWYETSALGLKSDLLHPNQQFLLNYPNIHPLVHLRIDIRSSTSLCLIRT